MGTTRKPSRLSANLKNRKSEVMIHSIGDSWCCREGDTGIDRGWQEFALSPQCRHGVSGTTAEEWNADKNGMLSTALKSIQDGDVVIVSLLGNDLRRGVADGNLDSGEVFVAVQSLMGVVDKIKNVGAKVVLLIYSDPFRGKDSASKAGVALMRTVLKGVAFVQLCETLDTDKILTAPEHFNGVDIHPTEAGHRAIAECVKSREW